MLLHIRDSFLIIDKFPDYKIGHVLAYVQGITADDRFCESLLQDYLNDKDSDKHDSISIEEFAEQEGVIL